MPNPLVEIVSVSKTKISNKEGMNQSIIKIRFDQPVIRYIAMLNGVDYKTGINVHEGNAVPLGEEADVIIDWNELDVEGENIINIYGLSQEGIWTDDDTPIILVSSAYGTSKYGKRKYGKKG